MKILSDNTGLSFWSIRVLTDTALVLFIVFINDILTDINSTIKLFADDTSLYLIVDDPQETAQTLNDDLVKYVIYENNEQNERDNLKCNVV
jgi:hypothetical protein